MRKITIEELREKADELTKNVERLCEKLDQRARDHAVWLEDMKRMHAEIEILRSELDPKGDKGGEICD